MKNRASSHLLILFVIVAFEATAYFALGRSALIRGYETSWVGGLRDLFIFAPIIALVLWLSRMMKYKGNWTLYTTAILLFSVGMLIQFRLYSDPEYNARNKAAARAEKTEALRIRYINENYDDAKKQMMGFPADASGKVPPLPVPLKQSSYSLENALTSSYTWIPITIAADPGTPAQKSGDVGGCVVRCLQCASQILMHARRHIPDRAAHEIQALLDFVLNVGSFRAHIIGGEQQCDLVA